MNLVLIYPDVVTDALTKRAKIYIKLSKPKLAAVYQGEIASPTGALSRLDMNSCAAGRVLEASFKRRSNAKESPRSEKNMEVATLTHQFAVLQIELARNFICKQSPARCWWHFWAGYILTNKNSAFKVNYTRNHVYKLGGQRVEVNMDVKQTREQPRAHSAANTPIAEGDERHPICRTEPPIRIGAAKLRAGLHLGQAIEQSEVILSECQNSSGASKPWGMLKRHNLPSTWLVESYFQTITLDADAAISSWTVSKTAAQQPSADDNETVGFERLCHRPPAQLAVRGGSGSHFGAGHDGARELCRRGPERRH
ncbi:Aste57867_22564 [Aphanomyces stellatus]|uniref:Aste57867_22564 protein n=1 Tax=Aphanomyces stellatus TaxID=120398 RepID=A0A485LKL9_9STRA|nr:hypothetical protein As57867_022494 [Aphanomyces stellatus]VFT99223.1 Aste57867_22564 [Aphanomyces stellatus]